MAGLGEVHELEQKYRKELWLNHGHRGIYGDDGEMQCIECHPYGTTDYKRDPLGKVEHAAFLARIVRLGQIEAQAQGGSVRCQRCGGSGYTQSDDPARPLSRCGTCQGDGRYQPPQAKGGEHGKG